MAVVVSSVAAAMWSRQTAINLPGMYTGRRDHPTGEQAVCSPCAAAGRAALGVTREVGRAPECWTCLQHREAREMRALFRAAEGRAEDLAEQRVEPCGSCGQTEPNPACWLCSWSWLHQGDAEKNDVEDDDRLAEDLLALALADETARRPLEKMLKRWRALERRAVRTVQGYRRGRGDGRAVHQLAAALHAIHINRSSLSGRPSATAKVAAMTALGACWKSGRRSRPGRKMIQLLWNLRREQTVSAGWARLTDWGWIAERVERGGAVSLAQRQETGRGGQRRAEFALAPLAEFNRDDLAPWLAAAEALMVEIAVRAGALAVEVEEELEEFGPVETTWIEKVIHAHLRTTISEIVNSLHTTQEGNKRTPTGGGPGDLFCSCMYWGFTPQHLDQLTVDQGCCSACGREKDKGGTSSSPTKEVCRTEGRRQRRWSHGVPREGAELAKRLQSECDLPPELEWLATANEHMLGSGMTELAREGWAAEEIVDRAHQVWNLWVSRGWKPPTVVRRPVALLRRLLESLDVAPSRTQQHRTQRAEQERARQRQAARDAAWNDVTVATVPNGTGYAAFKAARAALGHTSVSTSV